MKFNEIDPLYEARMSPTVFRQAVKEGGDLGVLVGFEFEVCVPKERVIAWENRGREVAEQEPVVVWGTMTVKGWLQKLERVVAVRYEFDRLIASEESVPGSEPATEKIMDAYYKETVYANYTNMFDQCIGKAYTRLVQRNYDGELTEWLKTREQRAVEVKEYLRSKGIDFDNAEAFNNFITSNAAEAVSTLTSVIGEKYRYYSERYYDTRREHGFENQNSEVAHMNAERIFWDSLIDAVRDRMGHVYQFDTADSRDQFARWVKTRYGSVQMAQLMAGPWKILPGAAKKINNVLGGYNPDYDPDRYRGNSNIYRRTAEFVKNVIFPVFNRPVHIFNSYHGGTKNLTDWYIEPDGSLRPNGNDGSCEIVGPPLPAPEAIQVLKNFYQVARENGFYTSADNKTGLHINVSIPRSLDVLKLATFVGDEHVLKQFGRENNSYANSVIKSLENRGSGRDWENTPDPMKKLKEIVRDISSNHMASVSSENSKYVSFRHAGGDYLNRAEDVENVVGRFVRSMVIASDPDAYREEYLNKASRFIQPKTPAKTEDPRQLIKQIRESGVKVYVQDVYLLGDREVSDDDLTRAVRKQYNSDNIAITNVQRNSQEAKDRMVAARTWRPETREKIEAADPSRFVSYTIIPTNMRGLTTMNMPYNLNDSFGVYLGGDKIAVGIRSSEQQLDKDDPIFRSLVREIVKKAQDQLISARQAAAQQAQQRAAELQPDRTAAPERRAMNLIDGNDGSTTLMISADFAEDAARIVTDMLNRATPDVQRQWRQRLPLRLRFDSNTVVPINWPAQVSTGSRPPERARYTVRDVRDGDILMTAAGPRRWEDVQQIARENAAARNVPQDAIRITDLDTNNVYYIDGTPVTAETMAQRSQQSSAGNIGPWVIIDTNQPADASGAVVAVLSDPMPPRVAADTLYDRSTTIYPGNAELASRLRIINASSGQVLTRINQEDDYIDQAYIDRARRAGRGQQSAPQSTAVRGAANGEWIVYRREDGQDRMVYRTNGTRSFDYARAHVIRDADTRSIPHNEFVFYNESSGLRYDADGELLPTRETRGHWRVYTRMAPSGVRELWNSNDMNGCEFGYAQERFENAEQNVRDRLVFYNADTNRAYDYNGQPVTDIEVPGSSPDTQATASSSIPDVRGNFNIISGVSGDEIEDMGETTLSSAVIRAREISNQSYGRNILIHDDDSGHQYWRLNDTGGVDEVRRPQFSHSAEYTTDFSILQDGELVVGEIDNRTLAQAVEELQEWLEENGETDDADASMYTLQDDSTGEEYTHTGEFVSETPTEPQQPSTGGGPFRAPHTSIFQIVDNRNGEILFPGRPMPWVEAEQRANSLIPVRGVPREEIRIIDLNTNRAYFITGTPAAETNATTPRAEQEYTLIGVVSNDEIASDTYSNVDMAGEAAQRWADTLGEPVNVFNDQLVLVYTAQPQAEPSSQSGASRSQAEYSPAAQQSQRRTYEIIDRDDADTTIATVRGTLEYAAAVAMNYERQGYNTVIFDEENLAHYDPRTLGQIDESKIVNSRQQLCGTFSIIGRDNPNNVMEQVTGTLGRAAVLAQSYRDQGLDVVIYNAKDRSYYDMDRLTLLSESAFLEVASIVAEVEQADLEENFADGKKPGRKGLAKRVGVNCKQSISKLRKIASNSSGERQRMAHWCANMKSGKKK